MIELPTFPPPAAAEPIFIDFATILSPALGGKEQRVERMGSRFGLSCTMPPMKGGKLGRQWISALIRAKQEGGRIPWPLQGFDPGIPGSPTVAGGGQAGRALAITGATAHYVVRDGQWFNHVAANGQHFLYVNVGETILDATGSGTLTIEPMLRRSPGNGDQVKLAGVMIEGFIHGDGQLPWAASVAHFVGLSFQIKERE